MTDQQTEDLLAERGTKYGDYVDNARITMTVIRAYESGRNWPTLPDAMKLSLIMGALKSHRIVNGDPFIADHWDDTAGYARLVSQNLHRLVPGVAAGKLSIEELDTLKGLRDGTVRVVKTSDQLALTPEENAFIVERRATAQAQSVMAAEIGKPLQIGDPVHVRGYVKKYYVMRIDTEKNELGLTYYHGYNEVLTVKMDAAEYARGTYMIAVAPHGKTLPAAATPAAGRLVPRHVSAAHEPPDAPNYSRAGVRFRTVLTNFEYEQLGYVGITEGSEKGRRVRSLYELISGQDTGAAPDHYARMRANKIEEYGL